MPSRGAALRNLALLLPSLGLVISALPLVALGPPGGGWMSIGPPGGRIDALGVTLATTVLSGTADGGIFRSDDSAGHWAPGSLLDVTLQRRVFAIVPDPVDPQSVFAVTGTLWKSGDGGSSWNQLSSEQVVAVAIAPSAHLTFYAVGEQKMGAECSPSPPSDTCGRSRTGTVRKARLVRHRIVQPRSRRAITAKVSPPGLSPGPSGLTEAMNNLLRLVSFSEGDRAESPFPRPGDLSIHATV